MAHDDIDRPRKRKQKRVFNRETGKHQAPAKHLDTTAWWRGAVGKHSQNKAGAKRTAKKIKGLGE